MGIEAFHYLLGYVEGGVEVEGGRLKEDCVVAVLLVVAFYVGCYRVVYCLLCFLCLLGELILECSHRFLGVRLHRVQFLLVGLV